MKVLIIAFLAISITVHAQYRPSDPVDTGKKVFCVYNSTSFIREGLGKITLLELEPAIPFCDFLIYGWAGIDPTTNKLKSLNERLDLDQGQVQGHFRQVTHLKSINPKLKVLLGVGGYADSNQESYMQLLENPAAYSVFINSAYTLIKSHNFDGLDLGWEFKPNKPKKIHSTLGNFWKGIKKTFGPSFVLDEKAEEHRKEFVDLVRQIKNAFRPDNFILSLTVLPNQNTSIHYDVGGLASHVDYVTLSAYDFQTWERNPKEADYPAPIYGLYDRIAESNVDYQVNSWLQQGLPAQKLIVAIPTHGRTWQLTKESTRTGVPPIHEIENPGQAGIQTGTPGFLSYSEVCGLLPHPGNSNLKGEYKALRIQRDPTKRYGSYAYRLPDENGDYGLWVGYEDPDTAQNKATYVVNKHLAGAAIHALQTDDFRGSCNGDKYPILRAVKNHFLNSH